MTSDAPAVEFRAGTPRPPHPRLVVPTIGPQLHGEQRASTAWLCRCGEHGFTISQPLAREELQTHLSHTGHRTGEYYYGEPGRRTSIEVTADPDGRFTHALLIRT